MFCISNWNFSKIKEAQTCYTTTDPFLNQLRFGHKACDPGCLGFFVSNLQPMFFSVFLSVAP